MSDPEPKKRKSATNKKRKITGSKVDEKANKVSPPKKKKHNSEDEISKSKQLVQKLQTSRSCSLGSRSRSANKNEVRLCGNGKPMPSLAELEKMFEDSDSDEEAEKKADLKPGPSITSTPNSSPKLPEKLTSPTTIERIANRMLHFVSNLTEPSILLDDDGPPPPVIKPKKRKKTEIPYIVGCKDRPYVPSKPNANFCKGDEDYGVETNDSEDEDDTLKKRAKRGKAVKLSKSIFNAASDEIAARLKEQDEANSDTSSDSNKTVAYEYYTPNTSNRVRSFSPLPSTSKDNETFVKNDQLYNKSLVVDNSSTNSINDDDDMEIIETPYETIEIKDTLPMKPETIENSGVIDLLEDGSNDTSDNKKYTEVTIENNDDVQLVDVKPASPIPVEDYYSTYCNLDTDASYNDDVCEVIDVDDVIAENAAIIKKYSRKDNFDTVTSVDMSNSVVSVVDPEMSAITVDNENNTIINEDVTHAQVNLHEDSTSSQVNLNDNVTNVIPTPIEIDESVQVAEKDLTQEAEDVFNIIENNIQRLQSILAEHNKQQLQNTLHNLQKGKHKKPNRTRNGPIVPIAALLSHPFVSEAHQVSPQIDKPPTSATKKSPEPRSKKLGDCPICLDTLSSKKAVASTMCGHIFCMNCIKLSIKANGKKCPTCRKALRGAGFHQIFL